MPGDSQIGVQYPFISGSTFRAIADDHQGMVCASDILPMVLRGMHCEVQFVETWGG